MDNVYSGKVLNIWIQRVLMSERLQEKKWAVARWHISLNRYPLLIVNGLNEVHALMRPAMQEQRSTPQHKAMFGLSSCFESYYMQYRS